MKCRLPSSRVDFLIVGVQKGGTTALDSYLRQHVHICMANTKEVHFFDNETLAWGSNINYEAYHAAFEPLPEHLLVGESTPIYSYWKPAAQRIWEYNKKIKLILLLRNPIERAYSHWNKEITNFHSLANKRQAVENRSFYEAIVNEKQRCQPAFPLQHRYYSYVDRGFYTKQIYHLLRYFPREQILLLKSESLKYDTKKTLEKIYSFLGVVAPVFESITLLDKKTKDKIEKQCSPTRSPRLNLTNTGYYAGSLSAKEKQYLIKLFTDEIKQLEILLGWDCSDWLK